MSKTEVAAKLNVSRQQPYDVLNGRQAVTPRMAVRLEAMFGRSADAWLAMQAAHDIWHARALWRWLRRERHVSQGSYRRHNACGALPLS